MRFSDVQIDWRSDSVRRRYDKNPSQVAFFEELFSLHLSLFRSPGDAPEDAKNALNWTFYTRVVGAQAEQIAAAHPGMFRQVVPAYILTDLLFALAFTFLFVKVGAALGGGRMAG